MRTSRLPHSRPPTALCSDRPRSIHWPRPRCEGQRVPLLGHWPTMVTRAPRNHLGWRGHPIHMGVAHGMWGRGHEAGEAGRKHLGTWLHAWWGGRDSRETSSAWGHIGVGSTSTRGDRGETPTLGAGGLRQPLRHTWQLLGSGVVVHVPVMSPGIHQPHRQLPIMLSLCWPPPNRGASSRSH